MKGLEKQVKKECRAWLRSIGAYVYSPVPVGYGAPTLDDLVCLRGRFIGIEYKAPGKMPTARQSATMTEIHKAGGIAFATDSLKRCQTYIGDHLLGQYTPAD